MPGFLLSVAALIRPPLALLQQASIFGLLWLRLGGSSTCTFICNWLDIVHVCNGCLEVGVRSELLLSHTKQLSNIDSFPSVTVDDAEQALRGDTVVLRWIVLLALVACHLAANVIQLGLTGRLTVAIAVAFALTEAKKLLHLVSSWSLSGFFLIYFGSLNLNLCRSL